MNDDYVDIEIDITADTIHKLKLIAMERDMSINDLIVEILTDYVEELDD